MSKESRPSFTHKWGNGGAITAPTNTKIDTGWVVEKPPYQTWNWMENRQDQALAYLMQQGVPEWDATIEYQNGSSFVTYSGIVYKSIQTGTNQNPSTATAYWAVAFDAYGAATTAENNAKTYADGLVVGVWNERGNFDASGGAYPSTGGSGSAGAIKKGDAWRISVAGTLPTGVVVNISDTVRALVNSPGQTQANWAVLEGNLGYTPENTSNKATDFSTVNDTLYPTVKAVNDRQRQLYNVQSGTSYTVVASDFDCRTILKTTNSSTVTITFPTPASLGLTTGDALTLRQSGTGTLTLAFSGSTYEGNATFTSQYEGKIIVASGSTTWDIFGA